MSKYNINSNQNLYSLLRLIDTDESNDITLKFSAEAEVYKNSLNLKTLKKLAEDRGKTLKFEVENAAHKDYIDAVNGDYIEYNDEEVNLEAPVGSMAKASMLSGFLGMFKKPGGNKEEYMEVEDEDESIEVDGSSEYAPIEKKKPAKKKKLIRAVVVAVIILLIVCSSAWAFFWYVPTATVSITVDAKGLIKLVSVKASTGQSQVSVENMAIPAISVEASATDSQKIATTGKKQTGDKAKGKIKITNKTSKKVTINKGSDVKLISSDKKNLLYLTTAKVEIDGTPNDAPDGTAFQSKEVEIEATNFGDDYNLDDTEKFEVDDKDTDEVVAENTDDIKGGSSKEINVVTQADLDSLKRTSEEAVKTAVQRVLSQKLVAGQVMQESSIEFNVTSANYSKKVDEEADEVSLETTMAGKVLAYNSSSLDELMKEVIKTVVPDSFNLDDDNPEYEVAATSVSNGTDVNLQVKLTSSITPRLDEEKIKKDLSGMAIGQAQSYLNDLNDVKGFEISISPNLPGVFLRMPQRSQNIFIKVNK